jgi:hypothetical protein
MRLFEVSAMLIGTWAACTVCGAQTVVQSIDEGDPVTLAGNTTASRCVNRRSSRPIFTAIGLLLGACSARPSSSH